MYLLSNNFEKLINLRNIKINTAKLYKTQVLLDKLCLKTMLRKLNRHNNPPHKHVYKNKLPLLINKA